MIIGSTAQRVSSRHNKALVRTTAVGAGAICLEANNIKARVVFKRHYYRVRKCSWGEIRYWSVHRDRRFPLQSYRQRKVSRPKIEIRGRWRRTTFCFKFPAIQVIDCMQMVAVHKPTVLINNCFVV